MGEPKRSVNSRTGEVVWHSRVDVGVDANGKRKQRRVVGPTKRACELAAAEALTKGESGIVATKDTTLADFLTRWLAITQPTVRASTHRRYSDVIRLYVSPELGGIKLARLSTGDLLGLYERLGQRISSTTVRLTHCILHHAFDDAVKWGALDRNPADAADPPRKARRDMATWNGQQVRQFLAAAADHELRTFFLLAIHTGMRRGELMGAKWSDLDLGTGSLAIQRTIGRGSTARLEEAAPKTAAGRRRIALAADVVEHLRQQRVRQLEHRLSVGPAWEDRDLIFADAFGKPLHPNTIMREFALLTAKAKLPAIRFHDLRHSSATLMLAAGISPKVAQERLGHSDIAMTLGLYSHVLPDMQTEAAAAIQAAITLAS